MNNKKNDNLIDQKLYKIALYSGLFLSVLSITANYMANMNFIENIKWLALLLLSTIALVMLEYNFHTSKVKFLLVFSIVWFYLPQGFLEDGTQRAVTYAYMMYTLILSSFLFEGKTRFFLWFSLISVFISMHYISHHFDYAKNVYTQESIFLESIIQIPIIIICSCFILYTYTSEYKQMNIKLSEQANFDDLTGLSNRRRFDRALQDIIKHKIQNVHLGFVDIDNFKKLNDSYGHSIGDEALRVLANFMTSVINPSQHLISRWGGDEFAIIYYGTKECLNSNLETINKLFNEYAEKYLATVKISNGVVSFSDYKTIEEAIKAADKILYSNKEKK